MMALFLTWVLTNDHTCPHCSKNHCEYAEPESRNTPLKLHCLACDERWEEPNDA